MAAGHRKRLSPQEVAAGWFDAEPSQWENAAVTRVGGADHLGVQLMATGMHYVVSARRKGGGEKSLGTYIASG